MTDIHLSLSKCNENAFNQNQNYDYDGSDNCRRNASGINSRSCRDKKVAIKSDADGKMMYHPKMDVTKMKTLPSVPEGLITKEKRAKDNRQ